jgi:hypothetical protein
MREVGRGRRKAKRSVVGKRSNNNFRRMTQFVYVRERESLMMAMMMIKSPFFVPTNNVQ